MAGGRWPEPITQVFINNEFVDTVGDATVDSYNPTTEKPIATFQSAKEADVNIAVAAANAAFEPGSEWRQMRGVDRRDLMNKLAGATVLYLLLMYILAANCDPDVLLQHCFASAIPLFCSFSAHRTARRGALSVGID
jgi:hypothetical protein